MSHDPNEQFDHAVLDIIEHSPTGAVPHTPAYQDALKRLHASHQAYPDADHKDGHVTARALARLPLFHAGNLDALVAGTIAPAELESNARIYDRYVRSLAAPLRAKAESHRLTVTGKAVHHRAKQGHEVFHDPVHTIFLLPGAGPHPGLPGNYLHGSMFQVSADATAWAVHVHDSLDGMAQIDSANLAEALSHLQETLSSAPFHLSELAALGFRMN
ncbi:MAG: hypothetical protein JWM88_17 [Verrucomicrobia bacterium]|nr:hypothetical protein [Verrucomicrobiota bacterium]